MLNCNDELTCATSYEQWLEQTVPKQGYKLGTDWHKYELSVYCSPALWVNKGVDRQIYHEHISPGFV